jgi:virulence factor Mce-like protein
MKRIRVVLFSILVATLAVGSVVIVRQVYFTPQTFTAYFSSVTGLYPGDEVRIAGVKVGTVESISPHPDSASVVMEVDHDVRVPADAKAVIVAQNLVAARYVQMAPLYRSGLPRLTDGAVIPMSRTAIPIEWDDVKNQLSALATELGPDSQLSTTSLGKFINSTADAMDGNGAKLRETLAELSKLARILADGSGNIVTTIKNLQTFVTALRDSSDEIVLFQDRLATFSTVLADSRTDLDTAMSELAVAVGEIQRFVAGTRDKTSEQVQRIASTTQVLVDNRMVLENILHVAPTAFSNGYNILHPNLPGAMGSFVLTNFANPVQFLCSAIGGVANVTAAETGKLCAEYLGPALRLLNFNQLPQPPINPFLAPVPTPDKLVYVDPALAPGGTGGAPGPPLQSPAVSAYTGAGDIAPPPGYVPPPPPGSPTVPTVDELLLPAEAPGGPVPSPTFPDGSPPP